MELDEMQHVWGELSASLDKQKKITSSLVLKMANTDYRYKLSKLIIPEAIGACFCLAANVYILLNLSKLTSIYLLAAGLLVVSILFLMCFLSLQAIQRLRNITIREGNYKDSMIKYAKARIQFAKAQKVSFLLGAILLLLVLPVVSKLAWGTDLFKKSSLWFSYVIGFPFYYWFARWVSQHYIKTATDAGNILAEAQEEKTL